MGKAGAGEEISSMDYNFAQMTTQVLLVFSFVILSP